MCREVCYGSLLWALLVLRQSSDLCFTFMLNFTNHKYKILGFFQAPPFLFEQQFYFTVTKHDVPYKNNAF